MEAQNTLHIEIGKVSYSFKAKVWKHDSPAAWYFVSVPKNISIEIRELFQKFEEGWGRLKCQAQIGNTLWETAIWYDTKHQAYILPLKAKIRRKEQIEIDQIIAITIRI
ncbi:DUF1905 domain-containing protein [Galbibacter sp. EGI 63066]|nr:DUF1905 domain-containing protein [Galbibacter sp. EGI 63066]